MAAALQHSSTTQCTGLSAPGTGSDAALFGCFGYATATEQGWCVGAAETNLRTGTDPGGRSARQLTWYALAKMAGIPNQAMIRAIEQGKDVRLSNVERVARALGLTLELVR